MILQPYGAPQPAEPQPRYSALGVDGEETTGSATALHKVLGNLAEFGHPTQSWPPLRYPMSIQKKALEGIKTLKKNSVSLFVVYMFFSKWHCQNIFHELVFHLFESVELLFRGLPTTRTTLTKKTQEPQATKQVRSTFISEVQLETPHQVIVDPWAESGGVDAWGNANPSPIR